MFGSERRRPIRSGDPPRLYLFSPPCGRNLDVEGQSGAGICPASISAFLCGRDSDTEGQSEAGIGPASASSFPCGRGRSASLSVCAAELQSVCFVARAVVY